MRKLVLLLATMIVAIGAPAAVHAHAMLDRAEPRVGNTVPTAPREVRLWFTQKLEQAFSSIEVTDRSGQRVDTGKARITGNEMAVSLRALGPGTYRVNWRVLSADTHSTDGNFTFAVGK